jgi:Tol biopolymer transport system component
MRMYPRFFGLLAVLTAIVLFSGVTPARSDSYSIYFESDRDGDYRIYRIEGTDDIPVTEPGCRHPSVTADNSMLFYTRIEETLWGRFWNIFYIQYGEEEKLTTNEIYDELDPVVSRDGTFVAYTTMRNANLEIITLPMDQNELQYRITNNQNPDELPALASGEEWVYWTGRTGNHSYIMKAPGRGGQIQRVTAEGVAWEEHPSVSADNRYLVYTAVVEEEEPVEEISEENTTSEDAVSRLDGVRIADSCKYPGMGGGTPAPQQEEEPEVTEDESRETSEDVAEDEAEERGNYEIWILDMFTGTRTRLTNNPAWDGNPSISSDGNVIVFTSDRDGNLEIYRMNRDGSGLIRLTENEANDDYATIS